MNSSFRFIVSAICFLVFFSSCNTEKKEKETQEVPAPVVKNSTPLPSPPPTPQTTLSWPDSNYLDLGRLKRGDSATVTFRLRNTGKEVLRIAQVQSGCDCTRPISWPDSLMPGKSGVIKAKYYSTYQAIATHLKQLFVTANTQPHNGHILNFKVQVFE